MSKHDITTHTLATGEVKTYDYSHHRTAIAINISHRLKNILRERAQAEGKSISRIVRELILKGLR